MILTTIGIGIACLILGISVTWIATKTLYRNKFEGMIDEAEKESEAIKQRKLFEVKEKFLNLKTDLEKQANSRNSKLQSIEAKLKQKEMVLNQKNDEV
ncbi:MAG: Rnase Y domain-containing protein, partial [Bacteroidales bacterium]